MDFSLWKSMAVGTPGAYLVGGMMFNMPDVWAVTFSRKHGSREDSVIFWLNLR